MLKGGRGKTQSWGSAGGWLACQICSSLIEAGDRAGLLNRSLVRLGWPRHPIMVQEVRRLHATFYANRMGDRVALK